jgi:outer membrane receptor protein involved in Fe transport
MPVNRGLILSATISILTLGVSVSYSAPLEDLTELPIEAVLNLEVQSASKFIQKKSDAPTAVTVISSQDIKDYGYRTLGDILQSVRGLFVTNDRNYSLVGARGYNIPGDTNTRFLVLLDGYRLNDATYDQGPIGSELPIDIDLIDRVEYLPGAGSAIYGNNAFFGVINIITKSVKDYKGKGVELSGRAASYGTDQERASFAKHFENGLEMLISGTRSDSKGENHFYFPELNNPDNNNGITSVGNSDKAERLFGKFSWRHLTLETGYGRRTKGLPAGNYGIVFNDPANRNTDQHIFLNLSYANSIAEHLELYARAYHGRYDYPGHWSNDVPPVTISQELGIGRWWGTEIRLSSTHIDKHRLMLGGEFQNNYQLSDQITPIYPANAYAPKGFNQSTNRFGIYFQDEMTLSDNLIFNGGIRYDHLSYAGDQINPRLALIYKPWDKTSLKLLYGSSFRAPNANELYYSDVNSIPNPNLKPETIKTYEGIVEYQHSHYLRLTAVGFHYEVNNIIQLDTGQSNKNQYTNSGLNKASGAEFEAEYLWDLGARLKTSYTWVNAYDAVANQPLINSPHNLFKLNFSTPLFERNLRAGIEAQYTDSRLGRDNTKTDAYPIFNLSLTSGDKLLKDSIGNLEISGSIYNLLNQHYSFVTSDEFVQHFLPQNGRNFRLVLTYKF